MQEISREGTFYRTFGSNEGLGSNEGFGSNDTSIDKNGANDSTQEISGDSEIEVSDISGKSSIISGQLHIR